MIEQLRKTAEQIKTSKKEILIQIFFVFILPVLFLQLGILHINARIPLLIGMVSLFTLLLFQEKWTWQMLHVETKSIKNFFIPYFVFTLLGIWLISSLGEKIGQEEMVRWWSSNHLIYLFFIVSLFQEVAYRGYLMPALQKLIANPILVVILNTIIFTYMHSLFLNPQINLPLAFVGGLGFALMYLKYPNLILIILSHAALNFSAILYGFFAVR